MLHDPWGRYSPLLHRPVALFAANLQVDSGIFAGKSQVLSVHIIYPVDVISPRHFEMRCGVVSLNCRDEFPQTVDKDARRPRPLKSFNILETSHGTATR